MGKVDFETLYFMKHLDKLAKLAKNGIKPFSEATSANRNDYVFYDETAGHDGEYPVVLQMCIIDAPCYHHDVVAYDKGDNYKVSVIIHEDGVRHLCVFGTKESSEVDYYIDLDGEWFFS